MNIARRARSISFLAACASVVVSLSGLRGADATTPPSLKTPPSLTTIARQVHEKHQGAVVNVKVVLKQKTAIGGEEMQAEDTQIEVTGTVVHASGLVVVSESEIDPNSLFAELGEEFSSRFEINSQTEYGEVKILLEDGKEIPARLVLRDKDLDLAFIAPKEKDPKLPFIDFAKAKPPEIFDDLLVLGRLGRNLNRAPAIIAARHSATIKKPRVFHILSPLPGIIDNGIGCPVFDAAGAPLGLLLKRRGGTPAASIFNFVEGFAGPAVVLLPGEDIKEVAAQALSEAEKGAGKKE